MAGEETIGTARIDVVVDTSQLEVAVSRAKNRTAEMSNAAQQEYAKLDRAEKRRIDRLIDQANTLNLTKEQQLAYNAALKTKGALLEDVTRRIAQNTAAQSANGKSAKELAMASRQLPMQFTDIFTSLATGQKPMYVLLQQGGQLKDVFGGVGNALKASAGYLMGLINPVTIAAAAVGGLALAWKSASDAQFEYQKALILSGNYAGKTVDDVRDLVDQLDRLSGVARGSATSAVLQTAQSGRFSGEQFDQVAEAAARMESSVGVSVDKTIAKFEAIAKDPVDALLKFNEAEHFLTRAQLDRIQALEEEGKHQEAVTEAIRLYGEAQLDAAAKAEQAMPAISRWWRDIKDEIGGATDQLGEYLQLVGEYASQRIPGAGELGLFNSWRGARMALDDLIDAGRARVNAGKPVTVQWAGIDAPGYNIADSAVEKARLKDREQFMREETRYLDDSAKKKKEIAEVEKLVTRQVIDRAEATKRIAQIEESYARKASKTKTTTKTNSDDNSAQSVVESIQRQITANEQLVQTGDKVSASDRLGIKARQLLADKTNTMTAATRKLIEALLPQLKASDDAAEAFARQTKAAEALARQNAILEAQSQNRARSNELDLMQYGRGSDAVEQLRRQLDIQREYWDELKRLGDRGVAEDKETWDKLADNAAKHRDEQLAAERQYQEDRLAAISDWRNGINAAMEDYLANAANIAARTYEAFSGMADALQGTFEEFFRTGKLDWKGFLDDINAEIARFVSQQLVRQILGGAAGGGTDGGLSGLIGLIFGASDSYTGFAKGGVFSGSPSLSKYSSQVVTKPTVFAFARGAGLMGEAGPEAIMPLRRLPSGRLGVEAAAPVSRGGDTYNISVPVSGRVDTRTRNQIANTITREQRLAARFG